MSKTAWIILIVAVILIVVVIVVVKKNASKKAHYTETQQQVVYQQQPSGKGAGFMSFLGAALPIVLDNINKNKQPSANTMAGAPSAIPAIA